MVLPPPDYAAIFAQLEADVMQMLIEARNSNLVAKCLKEITVLKGLLPI